MFTRRNQTTGYVLQRESYLTAQSQEWLMSRPKPLRVCGRTIPESLDDLAYGDLMDLLHATENGAFMEKIGTIVLRTTTRRMMRAPAEQIYGLMTWIGRELTRIAELFASIKSTPTDEERRAGVDDLDFGVPGVADWYARRMGMTDQDDALKVKWVRIYECMRMDNQVAAYERRLREILSKK